MVDYDSDHKSLYVSFVKNLNLTFSSCYYQTYDTNTDTLCELIFLLQFFFTILLLSPTQVSTLITTETEKR